MPDKPGLSRSSLSRVPSGSRPAVNPGELRPRVVHMGLGAFHRAHQALYTENAAARSNEPWGIVGVAPRSTSTVSAMRGQDSLYSVTERRPDGDATRVVGSLVDTVAMRDEAARVDALLSSSEVSVVTLTITEKGHHRLPDTGRLNTDDPAIAVDLDADRAELTTALGRLAAGLAARMRARGSPISVVSCENMAGNGKAVETVVRDFVAASSWPERDRLLEWMSSSVAFPSTVVDRIVPTTTDDDHAAAERALGVRDAMPVVGEHYRQWVLEDDFAGPRPPWERDGALFVPDVAPYQLTKLRLLNGAHSALAYLGVVSGCGTVADTMSTEWGESLVRGLVAEVAPTLPANGPDPDAYVEDLVERFANPRMGHRLSKVGSDGSLKLPERWFGPLRTLHRAPVLELALAGWAEVTRLRRDDPSRVPADPAADALADCWREDRDRADSVRALLRVLGAEDLAADDALVAGVSARIPAVRAGHIEL